MQASPHPCETYPPEIIEWSAMQADPDHLTERQERASDILTDDDVMRAAPHVLDVMLADNDRWQGEDRASRLDGFWRFIEEAAALSPQVLTCANPERRRYSRRPENYAGT